MATVSLGSTAGKWVMASAILASSMAFIDSTALNVALPALQRALNATAADLFWLLNAYLLILASLILVGGSLGDKLGRKRVFMWGIFIFIAGSGMCGFAPNANYLIAFRIIQGFGGALMIPGSLALISSSINEQERGKAIGTWSAATTILILTGPVLGGALADAGLWRYIFFINIPIGIVSLIVLWQKVGETRNNNADRAIDLPGAVTIALGLAFLTFGFLRAPALGFGHWQVYGAITAGVLLLVIFIQIERISKHPMMPLNLFANQTFSGVNLLTFFLYAGLGACMLFMSLNMVQIQGYTQLQSGLTFLPFTVLMMSMARLAGTWADKFGARAFLIGGPAAAGAGMLILSFIGQTHGASDYWTSFFPGIVVFGFGMSFTVAPLTATVMSAASDQLSGTSSGINNALTRISNVFANAIFGALAVLFFAGFLQEKITQTHFDPRQKQAIIAQAANLGGAEVPPSIGKANKAEIIAVYHEGFIAAYANIMRISAGLAFLGSLMAILFVRNKKSDIV